MRTQFRRNVALIAGVIVVAAMAALWPASVRGTESYRTRQTLLSAASTDETAVAAEHAVMWQCRETAVYVEWGTSVSAGVVEVETAYDTDYAGTWASLATVTYDSGSPKADVVQITGIHGALRTRISTAYTGGNAANTLIVSVVYLTLNTSTGAFV